MNIKQNIVKLNLILDLESQLKNLKETVNLKLPSIDKNANYAIKQALTLKNKFLQLKEAISPDLDLDSNDDNADHLQNMNQVSASQFDQLQEQVDKLRQLTEDLQRDINHKFIEEQSDRTKGDRTLEQMISKITDQIANLPLFNHKLESVVCTRIPEQTKEPKEKVKPQTTIGQQRGTQDLADEESTDQNIEEVLKSNQHEQNPIDKEHKTQDNYFKLTADQVYQFMRKQLQKIKRKIADQDDKLALNQNENNSKFIDLRKLITDLQTNNSLQFKELEQILALNLQTEVQKLLDEISKKSDQNEVDRLFQICEDIEQRLKPIESMKLMLELGSTTMEERINTLKFKMEAFDHKMGIVIQRLSTLVQGQLDKSLTQSIDEIASQKRQIEESMAAQANNVGGGGGVSNRELTDKVQRIYHQLEELKKSYFKKMKEVDATLHLKASKEALNTTEKKILEILEMTFSQLGDKFASKPQTSEAVFKLKSQMKSIFELLISSGVINMNEEDTNEETAMFSKKPLQGLACASCETKLKNISVKPGMFTQWNKLPTRDPLDRLPRAGQGFSKILQNIKNPKDLEWDNGNNNLQSLVLGAAVSQGMSNSEIKLKTRTLTKNNALSKSHILIPQQIQPPQINTNGNDSVLNQNDFQSLPKITTPRRYD